MSLFLSTLHIFTFFILMWNILLSQSLTSEKEVPPQVFAQIAKKKKKTLSQDNKNEALWSVHKNIQEKGIKQYCIGVLEGQKNPNLFIKQQELYNILSSYELTHPFSQSAVLDYSTWQDIELLSGPKSNPSASIVSFFDRTTTHIGKAMLNKKLISPEIDISKLEIQQQALSYLLIKNNLFKRLNNEFAHISGSENLTLSFWDNEDLFVNVYLKSKIQMPFARYEKHVKWVENALNQSPIVLQVSNTFGEAVVFISNILILYSAVALITHIITGEDIKEFLPPEIAPFFPSLKTVQHLSPLSFSGALMFLMQNNTSSIIPIMANANDIYWALENLKNGNFFVELLFTKTQHVSQYLTHAVVITKIISQHPELLSYCSHIKEFYALIQEAEATKTSFSKLIKLLSTSTFTGNFNKYTTFFGRILVAFGLILENQENLIKAMLAMGEVDTLLSTIKLILENQETTTPYSLPTFLDSNNYTPTLHIVDAWHPGIAQEKVISNSISLGNAFSVPQNAIITGPNAGGKSTITKSFILAALSAQSLGIAPAKSIVLTPFAKIITYLNITDDIAAGNSHFQAGVFRARTLIETINALPSNHYMLCAIDEIFNGTTFKEGQAAAYSFIKALGDNPRGICITNTHFPLIPTLEEQEKTFLNYKVSVIEEKGQRIKYPFKLERGISQQVVTLKILQEEGFDDAFLLQAYGILNKS